jgi:hypothetical protein
VTDSRDDPRQTYETPHLIRYGTIEELTQGANAITTSVTDLLSIQSSDLSLKRSVTPVVRALERLRAI